MPADPVLAGFDRAESEPGGRLSRAWLTRAGPHSSRSRRSASWWTSRATRSWRVALEQPDWGSGERYRQ